MSEQTDQFVQWVLVPPFDRQAFANLIEERGFVVKQGAERGANESYWREWGDGQGRGVWYNEDHLLGVCSFTIFGPDARATLDAIRAGFRFHDPVELAEQAAAASTPVERIQTLNAVVRSVMRLDDRSLAHQVLRARLADDNLSVRYATVLAASYLNDDATAALLDAYRDDPVLGAGVRRVFNAWRRLAEGINARAHGD